MSGKSATKKSAVRAAQSVSLATIATALIVQTAQSIGHPVPPELLPSLGGLVTLALHKLHPKA
jgi:hypothetical protein